MPMPIDATMRSNRHRILLTNATLYAPEPLGPGSVLVEGHKIAASIPPGHRLPDVESIDLGGAALGPGLIDLHTHGADGVDLHGRRRRPGPHGAFFRPARRDRLSAHDGDRFLGGDRADDREVRRAAA